jgi:hypothetical protein
MKKVKSEDERALPFSLSYINIDSSCILIYLQRECRSSPFTFTLHHLVSQIGQVPKICQNFVCVQINLPGVGRESGGGGGGFSGSRRQGSGDRWERVGANGNHCGVTGEQRSEPDRNSTWNARRQRHLWTAVSVSVHDVEPT